MKVYVIMKQPPMVTFDEPIEINYYYAEQGIYYFDKGKLYKETIKKYNSYKQDNLYIDSNIYEKTEVFYIPFIHYECKEFFYNHRINENLTLVKHTYDKIEHMYFICDDLTHVMSFISHI
tara:strand:- start:165 stop:524 length:360 start_codon:yes stop_codon:yes gene_type:complete